MKKGKEVSIPTEYQYNIKSGTPDNRNPKSLYLQISSWGNPKKKDIENYESILKNRSKKIKRKIFEILDENVFYKNYSIVNFNMASSGITYGKRSFMSVEITLFKKEPLMPLNSKDMILTIKNISDKIITEVLETDEDFKFFKTKN